MRREADVASVAKVPKQRGLSVEAQYVWKKRFGKMEPVDARSLRRLETANGRMKKLEMADSPRLRNGGLARPEDAIRKIIQRMV